MMTTVISLIFIAIALIVGYILGYKDGYNLGYIQGKKDGFREIYDGQRFYIDDNSLFPAPERDINF